MMVRSLEKMMKRTEETSMSECSMTERLGM